MRGKIGENPNPSVSAFKMKIYACVPFGGFSKNLGRCNAYLTELGDFLTVSGWHMEKEL
jgi:hypothetical protein